MSQYAHASTQMYTQPPSNMNMAVSLCDYIPVQSHGKTGSGLLFYLLWRLIIPVSRTHLVFSGVKVCAARGKDRRNVHDCACIGTERECSQSHETRYTAFTWPLFLGVQPLLPSVGWKLFWRNACMLGFLIPLLCSWPRVIGGKKKATGFRLEDKD